MESDLILTGFMGTGKTSVGKAIAERLGRMFIDTDAWIEQRAGKSVSAIFADDGEDRFRAYEAEACEALAEPRNLVIATGGWTLGPEKNRAALQRGGDIICLRAEPDTLLARLSGATDRPLLANADRADKLRTLLNQRDPVYRSFAWQVDTTRMNVADVTMQVMALWGAIHHLDQPASMWLPMRERGGTSILFGAGLADAIGPILRARGLNGRVALVSDSNVAPLHGDRVAHSLESAGFESALLRIPAGEESKTLDSVAVLFAAFVDAGLERGDLVIALGGGVIGDLAGFAAATYLRGVRWVCVPTSLLAMVDASIGGKVGVDLPAGKNLAGAFHPPLMTLGDTDLLHTLPGAEFRSGLAEVIKAGVIADPELFEMIEHGSGDLGEMIRRALRVKVEVVIEDPFEAGRRAALNLGHTIGHGLEAASKFALRHGEAIGIGMIAAARIAEQLGLAQPGLSDRIEAIIAKVDLPTRYHDLDLETIMTHMQSDKKKKDGRIRFALPRSVGDVLIGVDVKDDLVIEALNTVRE